MSRVLPRLPLATGNRASCRANRHLLGKLTFDVHADGVAVECVDRRVWHESVVTRNYVLLSTGNVTVVRPANSASANLLFAGGAVTRLFVQ